MSYDLDGNKLPAGGQPNVLLRNMAPHIILRFQCGAFSRRLGCDSTETYNLTTRFGRANTYVDNWTSHAVKRGGA